MLLAAWFILIFALGAAVGSFLNVCIYRLPLEKSILWPSSRCSSCLQPIRLRDNIPLLSYWLLRGRCRECGARFSVQYFLVELLTGLAFVVIFYLEVIANIHRFRLLDWHAWEIREGAIPWQAWIIFGHHAILISLLIAAAFCDLMHREIPLSITVPGTLIGLVGAVLWPWPWPLTAVEAQQAVYRFPARFGQPWWQLMPGRIPEGLYPWPVWGPLPDLLAPGGNWQTGLATGLAGAVAGTLLLRSVRGLFSTGLGKEALGMGDADLMMMAGAFLGWQPVVVALFVSAFPGLLFALGRWVAFRDNSVAFGPSLAIALAVTWLGWPWIGPLVQPLLFFPELLLTAAGAAAVFLFASSLLLRVQRAWRGSK